jgi:hypothetical protein
LSWYNFDFRLVLQIIISKKASEQQRLNSLAGEELEEALPPLREAEDAISSLDPHDLDEMHSYVRPPEGVMLVCSYCRFS